MDKAQNLVIRDGTFETSDEMAAFYFGNHQEILQESIYETLQHYKEPIV